MTVPPPAGEDDAYSAATKVGAMPADIMEKLRAEGLLPDDVDPKDRETPVASIRPSTSLDRREPVRALVSAPPISDGAPIPQLFSTQPPALPPADDPAAQAAEPTPVPPPIVLSGGPGPAPMETPVAFAYPPSPKLLDGAGVPAPDLASPSASPAPAAAPSRVTMAVVAVVVVVLLIVALIRLAG